MEGERGEKGHESRSTVKKRKVNAAELRPVSALGKVAERRKKERRKGRMRGTGKLSAGITIDQRSRRSSATRKGAKKKGKKVSREGKSACRPRKKIPHEKRKKSSRTTKTNIRERAKSS